MDFKYKFADEIFKNAIADFRLQLPIGRIEGINYDVNYFFLRHGEAAGFVGDELAAFIVWAENKYEEMKQ